LPLARVGRRGILVLKPSSAQRRWRKPLSSPYLSPLTPGFSWWACALWWSPFRLGTVLEAAVEVSHGRLCGLGQPQSLTSECWCFSTREHPGRGCFWSPVLKIDDALEGMGYKGQRQRDYLGDFVIKPTFRTPFTPAGNIARPPGSAPRSHDVELGRRPATCPPSSTKRTHMDS